ncbi:MAG: PstS family phosphate ABC transporter substrate-binding protein [Desulfovibrionaceae bacterium]|nr:PstS family phosphate ABC transporter substrate-binding protein [Desulfovibrionaceae bacterium]
MNRTFFAALTLTLVLGLSLPAWAGSLKINGSTTVLPIAQKVAEAYMKENPAVSISISGGGSSNGLKALIDGNTDIADASRFIKDKEIELAVDNGRYPVPFAIAYDSIVPIVHPSNKVNDLSIEQLRDIYMGKITNWKDVGGDDRPIVVISRDSSSGTFETWAEKVMHKERVFAGAQMTPSAGAADQAVAKNKYAIAYNGIGYLNKAVKGLAVNGVQGSKETTLNGQYPISRPLFMFTNGWPSGETADFIRYVLHPAHGQKAVAATGYVPLY